MKSEKTKKTIPFIPIATSLIGLSLCPLIAQATTATIQPPQEASTTNSRAIATFNLNDWTYSENTDSITLTKYNGTETSLYIPGEYNGKQITLKNLSIFPKSMTDLQIQETNGKKVKIQTNSLYRAFYNNKTIRSLDLNGLDISNVTNLGHLFYDASKLETLNIDQWNTSNVTNFESMFIRTRSLTNLNLDNWDLSSAQNMSLMFYSCYATSLSIKNWDTSNVTNMSQMFDGANFTTLDVSNWDTSNVTNMSRMFSSIQASTLDVSNWDTSKVTDMSDMFSNAKNLTSLDVSNWDTSKVTDMSGMFSNAEKLTSLDVSNWDTSKVPDMSRMFYNAKNLNSLDVSNWDTSKVTDMSGMFYNAKNLTSLDVSNWDTSNVTSMSQMFYFAEKLSSLDVSQWDTSNVTSMSQMFSNTSKLSSLDVSLWDTHNVSNMYCMFYSAKSLTTLDVSQWNTAKVTNMSEMFANTYKLTSLNTSRWDTGNVTNMSGMFNSSRLSSLDVSQWNTAKVTNMSNMFRSTINLEALDVSNWDTGNVINMSGMFYSADELAFLDVSQWNTAKVTNMSEMFAETHALKSLNVTNWNTANVTNMYRMFYKAGKLEALDVSNWDTGKVTNMSGMFAYTLKLTSLNTRNWNTENVTNMSEMFCEANTLETLDVSNWDTGNVTNMSKMFDRAYNLQRLDVSNWDTGNVTNMSKMFTSTHSLTTLDVKNWNTSNVTTMEQMFYGAGLVGTFDAKNWNTSKVTNMKQMFYGYGTNSQLTAIDARNWDTSNVSDMTHIFADRPYLTALNLQNWVVQENISVSTMFHVLNNTPLLLVTRDEKLKNYDFKTSRRVGVQMTFDANGGFFSDNKTLWKSEPVIVLDSLEESYLNSLLNDLLVNLETPIHPNKTFERWNFPSPTSLTLEATYELLTGTYLAQWKTNPFFDDLCGQDFKAPDMPVIKEHGYTEDGLIWLTFDPVEDHGSTYSYYVQATHLNGTGVAFSNIASATVTTGVKGYSWIADSNPDTIPDEIIEQTSNQTIQIPTNNQGPYYLHIKAIDNAGNASETFHYELTDTTKPTFTLTQNPTDWTNQDVIITVDAADGGTIPSGIKEIILPDGNKVSGDTATFTAIENGTYTFEVVDFMGNRQTESITISNIDKIKPTGSIIIDQDQEEFYEEETELHLNMSDILDGQEKLSGIATVEIFDVNGTYRYTLTNPTDYQPTIPWVLVPYEMPDGSLKAQVGMTLTDKAGNTTTVYSKEVTIIKVRIDEFHLTDVINPRIYNSQNPFQRLSYPYIPSQELLVGGSFEFEAIYTYPPTANSSWKATYEANIHYIHPTNGTTTIPLVLEKQSVDGQFTVRHAIPLTAKVGTEVYLELRVAVYNSSGKLMGEDTFPDPAGTLLKIGEITGDIRELIQFNEIY